MTEPLYVWADTETRSPLDLKTHGTARYAEEAEILLFMWAVGDDPVSVWDLTAGDPCPAELEALLLDDAVVFDFHNAWFDRTILRLALNSTPAMRHLASRIDRWRDTMVKAMLHSLPGALDKLGVILGLSPDQQKDKRGTALIRLFCCKPPQNVKRGWATCETHPDEWAEFIEYGIKDVTAQREINKRLPDWNYKGVELDLWHLDQRMNERGICVDLDLAHAAIKSSTQIQSDLAARVQDMTDNAVTAATQRDKMLLFILEEYGVEVLDLKGSTVEKILATVDLPAPLRELLEIRVEASRTSTSKYKRLLNLVSRDNRLRGIHQFGGALRTNRWAGRGFQPQNLMRPPKYVSKHWEAAVAAIKADAVDLLYPSPMEVISACVRGVIVAPSGKKLVTADLSNIEGRVLAWLAGEAWKLQAFRDYDAGVGPDLYKLAYAKAFNVPVETISDDGPERQVGKVMELALGFGGGVGAFLTFALAYNIDLEAMGEQAYKTLPADVLRDAEGMYDWTVKKKRKTYGLSKQAFLVCEAFKRLWRDAHPNTVKLWAAIEEAMRTSIGTPGKVFTAGKLRFVRTGAWLQMQLPSGRRLCYPSPRIDDKGRITYNGVNQFSRKYGAITTYGGKGAENATQALARDVFASTLPEMERQGYAPVMLVHDEGVTETPDSPEFNVAGLTRIMSTVPLWAPDLPLAAAGWEGPRYRK